MARRRKLPQIPSPTGGREEARQRLLKATGGRLGLDFDPTDVLKDLLAGCTDPGSNLAWLSVYDADPTVRQAASVSLGAGLSDEDTPAWARKALSRGARPVLEAALHDMDLADDRKIIGLGVLNMITDGKIGDPTPFFHDFTAAVAGLTTHANKGLGDTPESLEMVLRQWLHLDDQAPGEAVDAQAVDGLARVCAATGASNADGALALACCALPLAVDAGVPTADLLEVIDAVASQAGPRGAWWARVLAEVPGLGEAAVRMRGVDEQLRQRGVAAAYTILPEFSHGKVSIVDGAGSREVMLFYRTPDGGLDGLALMLNDTVGVKDSWAVWGSGAELESDLTATHRQIPVAACPLDRARELVAHALAINEQAGWPPRGTYLPLLPYLSAEPLLPRRRQPNLGAYMLETMRPSAETVAGSEDLMRLPMIADLSPLSDRTYDFVRAQPMRRGRWPGAQVVDQFIVEVAVHERDVLLGRLAMNLELEAWAGRAVRDENQLAAQAYLAWRDDAVPMEQIPLVRALAEDALRTARHNIRRGCQSQAEANAAEFERDAPPLPVSQLLRELLDSDGLG